MQCLAHKALLRWVCTQFLVLSSEKVSRRLVGLRASDCPDEVCSNAPASPSGGEQVPVLWLCVIQRLLQGRCAGCGCRTSWRWRSRDVKRHGARHTPLSAFASPCPSKARWRWPRSSRHGRRWWRVCCYMLRSHNWPAHDQTVWPESTNPLWGCSNKGPSWHHLGKEREKFMLGESWVAQRLLRFSYPKPSMEAWLQWCSGSHTIITIVPKFSSAHTKCLASPLTYKTPLQSFTSYPQHIPHAHLVTSPHVYSWWCTPCFMSLTVSP